MFNVTDFSVIDQLRSAKMAILAGSQSTTSIVPAFKSKEKAKTFMLNCTNVIVFRSADKDCSELSADTLGKKQTVEDLLIPSAFPLA